ncbi:polyubiquitin-like [Leucoraja erinacea]|uniref:polyubiquitin-like n=1 Tax=Leucoraja erinaceus TaxID=7782 RepID=UPI002454F3D5|nr:polyubiquitin-like [Leucoraja erinacea]
MHDRRSLVNPGGNVLFKLAPIVYIYPIYSSHDFVHVYKISPHPPALQRINLVLQVHPMMPKTMGVHHLTLFFCVLSKMKRNYISFIAIFACVPQPVKPFEITVTALGGNSLRLTADIYFKVSELKCYIQQKWTIPVSQQRLVFSGTILDDGKTLLDAMIFFDATIQLLVTIGIFVNYNGSKVPIQVLLNDTVSSLKTIEPLKTLQPSQYYLTFQSRPLEDDRTLGYYNINQQSIIDVNLRLRGGSELQCFNANSMFLPSPHIM